MVGGGGWVVKSDSSVISLVKESRLLTFSYLNEGDLESTLTSLDQELDKKVANTRFFLRIFFPAHFDHWKLR